MFYLFWFYIAVIVVALVVGIASCFTSNKWISIDEGMIAGIVLVACGILFGPICTMYLASSPG